MSDKPDRDLEHIACVAMFENPKVRLSECEEILARGRSSESADSREFDYEYQAALNDFFEIQYALGLYQEVVDSYLKYQDGNPMTIRVTHFFAAKAMIKLGEFSAAIPVLEKYIEDRGAESVSVDFNLLTEAYDLAGQPEKAVKARQSALNKRFEERLDFTEGMREVAKALPNSDLAQGIHALNLGSVHDYAGAIVAIRRAIELSPNDQSLRDKLVEYERALELKKSGN